jgi:hypothetical protein
MKLVSYTLFNNAVSVMDILNKLFSSEIVIGM